MKKKSQSLEAKLNATTIKILIGSIVLTVACLIISTDTGGLFPQEFKTLAKYSWMVGALISIFALGMLYRDYSGQSVDSE